MNGSVLQSILFGGLFIGVLSALPLVNLGNCCCLWITGGGALAAYLEQQRTRQTVLPARGAVLGLTAGIVGAVIWLLVDMVVDMAIGPLQQRMAAAMLSQSVDMPPEVRELLEAVSAGSSRPMRFVVGFFFQLFAGFVFSTLGGALGAVYFRRDVPPALGGDRLEHPPIPE